MTSTRLLFALLFSFAALASCKSNQNTSGNANENGTDSTTTTPVTQSCAAVIEGEAGESDPINQINPSWNGNCLELELTYGGGCEEHEVALYWGGMWAESMPPQAGLTLVHDAKGDRCRSLVKKTFSFDMSALQYDGTNKVILNLSATGLERYLPIEYNY